MKRWKPNIKTIKNPPRIDPMLCFNFEEVSAILENVLDEEMIDGFYEWLDNWSHFLFEKANFVVVTKRKKDSEKSFYCSYKVWGGQLRIKLYEDGELGKSVTFVVDPQRSDFESIGGLSIRIAGGSLESIRTNLVSEETSEYVKGEIARIQSEEREMNEEAHRVSTMVSFAKEINKGLSKPSPNMALEAAEYALSKSTRYRDLVSEDIDMNRGHQKVLEGHIRILDSLRNKALMETLENIAKSILCSLYYYTLRGPKVFLKEQVSDTAGWKKYNDLYNPFRSLTPRSIVRPKNGTRLYLENNRTRKTESWHVRGHTRKYKSGKIVWISPYIKGTGEGLRLSIYVDGENDQD